MCVNLGHILRESYQIIAHLGCGGFATTYTANDLSRPGNPMCVVKVIPFPKSNEPRVLEMARRRFEREASALRRQGNHACIPNLFACFEENNYFYLVQEYIQGHPLSQELSAGEKWTEQSAIALLREILEILQSVHEVIIHRDITPSNLIRRETDRKIVLIDFGAVKEISTFTANSTGEILTSQAIGTRGYMPAEQYNPQSVPQPYNDIYSVGIIAIQALTGKLPTNLPHDPQTCEIVWDYSTPDRPAVQVSDSLKKILTKMVRLDFKQRYQSVAEVLQELDALAQQSHPEVLKHLEKSDKQPKSPKPAHFPWLLLGVAVIAAGAIVLLIGIISQPPSPPKPSPEIVGEKTPISERILSPDGISSVDISPALKGRGFIRP